MIFLSFFLSLPNLCSCCAYCCCSNCCGGGGLLLSSSAVGRMSSMRHHSTALAAALTPPSLLAPGATAGGLLCCRPVYSRCSCCRSICSALSCSSSPKLLQRQMPDGMDVAVLRLVSWSIMVHGERAVHRAQAACFAARGSQIDVMHDAARPHNRLQRCPTDSEGGTSHRPARLQTCLQLDDRNGPQASVDSRSTDFAAQSDGL
jgi:hypothetical protein